VLTVYAIGLFQGLSLVAFPAAATILTASTGYDLSKSQYGLMFIPRWSWPSPARLPCRTWPAVSP
jgi:hypothetical protein